MGISVSVANSESKSVSVSKVGTPLYTSPEVLKRQPFDFKVDIWALGCLLYYMACLQPPFQVQKEEDHVAKLDRIRSRRKSQSPFIMNANPAGSKSPFRG